MLGGGRGAYMANGALAAAGFVPEAVRLHNEIESEKEALRSALRESGGIANPALRERADALSATVRRQHQACIGDSLKGGGMLTQAKPFDFEWECEQATKAAA